MSSTLSQSVLYLYPFLCAFILWHFSSRRISVECTVHVSPLLRNIFAFHVVYTHILRLNKYEFIPFHYFNIRSHQRPAYTLANTHITAHSVLGYFDVLWSYLQIEENQAASHNAVVIIYTLTWRILSSVTLFQWPTFSRLQSILNSFFCSFSLIFSCLFSSLKE